MILFGIINITLGSKNVNRQNPNKIDYRMTGCFSQQESEANEFAGRLLMPEKEIQKVKQLLENMEGKSILSELACYFGVSMQALMLRLQKTGGSKIL